MINNKIIINTISLVVLLLVIFSCIAALLTIYFGTESYSVLHVFSHDESDQVQRLQRLLKYDTLNTGGFINGFYSYGQLYPTIAFWIAKTVNKFGFELTSYQSLVIILKVTSIIFYCLSGYLIYKTMILLDIDRILSCTFAFVLLVFPKYWSWSYSVHPDTLQMLTIIIPAYILLRYEGRFLPILLASFFVGVSFGTKYSGVFLVVFISSYAIIFALNNNSSIREFFILSSWSIISFLTGWLLFNPYVMVNFAKFFTELYIQGDYLKYGVGVPLNQDGLAWFRIYYHQYGGLVSSVVLFGLIYSFMSFIRELISYIRNKQCVIFFSQKNNIFIFSIFIYLLVSIAYLVFVVKYREVRYSFHVLPYLIILSAFGINLVLKKAKISRYGIIFVSILIIASAFPSYSSNLKFLANQYNVKLTNPFLKSGNWLVSNYSSDTSILAGTYSYIESSYFKRFSMTYELNLDTINEFYPDIVVMNRDIPGRYVWKKPGTLLTDMDLDYGTWEDNSLLRKYHDLYVYMTSHDSGWSIVYEDDAVIIFDKSEVL